MLDCVTRRTSIQQQKEKVLFVIPSKDYVVFINRMMTVVTWEFIQSCESNLLIGFKFLNVLI